MKAVDVIVLLLVAAAVVAAVIHSIRARRKRSGGCGCGCGCDRCSAACKTIERKTQEKQPPSRDDTDEQSPHGHSPR